VTTLNMALPKEFLLQNSLLHGKNRFSKTINCVGTRYFHNNLQLVLSLISWWIKFEIVCALNFPVTKQINLSVINICPL
jgi:hypothetical protein